MANACDVIPLVSALAKAFANCRGIIVAAEQRSVNELYVALKNGLAPQTSSIGILAGERADDGDVVVMTAAMLNSGIIRANDRGFLIFIDPPRKGELWSSKMAGFFAASKFALCNTLIKYPPWRMKQIEATFGPTVNDRRYKPMMMGVAENEART